MWCRSRASSKRKRHPDFEISLVVGRLLRTRGQVFLEHVFAGDSRVVAATNFLLNIGFYLLCLGLLLVNVANEPNVNSVAGALRSVSLRLGVCVIVVAALHSVNVVVLALLIRRTSRSASSAA